MRVQFENTLIALRERDLWLLALLPLVHVGHTFLMDSELEWTPLMFMLPNAPDSCAEFLHPVIVNSTEKAFFVNHNAMQMLAIS